MKSKELMNNLSKLGVPMFEPREEVNVKETLAEVVKTHDPRLWEAFPVLLANAVEKYNLNLEEVAQLMPNNKFKNDFRRLLLMSWSLYSFYHLKFPWINRWKNYISKEDKSQVKLWRNDLVHNHSLKWDNTKINPLRLKNAFELYFKQSTERIKQQQERSDEFSLAFALSQIFSPRQIDIFNKRLKGKPLSKTEQEYYSRSVKKKVVALANSELHSLARRLLQQ